LKTVIVKRRREGGREGGREERREGGLAYPSDAVDVDHAGAHVLA